MNPYVAGLLILALLSAGCSQRTPEQAKIPSKASIETEPRNESLQQALDVLRRATELPQFREALAILNQHLGRESNLGPLQLTPAQQKLLTSQLSLGGAEIHLLEGGVFRPFDAYHLEESFLLHETARALKVPELRPLEQAGFCLGWVARRLLLHEQGLEGVPPVYLLERGYGSGSDRALVFLRLIQQMGMDGVLLTAPPAEDGFQPVLAGVLWGEKESTDLYLFDPRQGKPVAGPDGIATLAQARKDPNLLKASGLSPEQVANLQTHLAVSLPSLEPRMAFLESEIGKQQDPVVLHQSMESLLKKLALLGADPVPFAGSPVLLWQKFLSTDEGGSASPRQFQEFQESLLPWGSVVLQLHQLRVFKELPPPARETLLSLHKEVLNKFYLQPQKMLIRGQYDATIKRLQRIANVLSDVELTGVLESPEFFESLQDWRARLIKAYNSNQAEAMKNIWGEDQFFWYFLQAESDEIPRKVERKALSLIILRAGREALNQRTGFLLASCWEEKAEKAQAALDKLQSRDTATQREQERLRTAAEKARNAWLNTKSGWSHLLGRSDLGLETVARRLELVRLFRQSGDFENMVRHLESLHLDLHLLAEARLQKAEAHLRLGENSVHQAILDTLREELTALDRDQRVQKEIGPALDQLRSVNPSPTQLIRRLELLQRDWTARGNQYWLRQRVNLALSQ